MEQLFPSQSRALVAEARSCVERARAQETAEGNPRVGAEEYVRAAEMILAAIDCCPCKDAESRRALQAACLPKLTAYYERARLLLRVAKEEEEGSAAAAAAGSAPSQVGSSCHGNEQRDLMLHQEYIMSQFQPLGAPAVGGLAPPSQGTQASPPASYYFPHRAPPQQPEENLPLPHSDAPQTGETPGTASFDRLLQDFLNKK
jgi:hypothetical protein